MKSIRTIAAAGLLAALAAAPAHAVTDYFELIFGKTSSSTNSPATGASGTVGFKFEDTGTADVAKLSLEILNTTGSPLFGDEATASKLVGFGFDLVSGVSFKGNFSGVENNFDTLTKDVNSGGLSKSSGPGPGRLDVFTGTDGDFLGGGAPADGLDPTESVTVSFELNYGGTSVDNAMALSDLFLAFFQSDDGSQAGALSALRFQEVSGDGFSGASDKLYDPDVNIIPVPAGVLLIGSAFLVAGAVSARARRKAA